MNQPASEVKGEESHLLVRANHSPCLELEVGQSHPNHKDATKCLLGIEVKSDNKEKHPEYIFFVVFYLS